MIDSADKLSVQKQAKLLKISRSSVYYQPRPLSEDELTLMRKIDELHLEYPFAGNRMLRDFLERDKINIGRRHMRTVMRRMGIEAIYRKPNTSKPAPGHKIYPSPQPSVVNGHLLCADETRLRLSGCGDRLVQSARVELEVIEYDGRLLLS